ncbi:MAG TPA: glycosyltransferase family 87 protein [Sphingomicrobium sp.]|nr:glycosyltransferase family 87 protein [Sphingomicrobium sp.]
MQSFLSGAWLTRDRVSRIAVICAIIGLAMLLFLWLAGNSTLDFFGKPIGSDFAAFWEAGHIANQGNPARAWDQALLNGSVETTHGVEYGTAWIYPPVFLLVAVPLGAMPYLPAVLVWQLFSLLAVAVVLKGILRSNRDTLVALASPLTPLVLANGQNSFFTAALLGAGLLSLERRPALAGTLFGGLVYKPQLGVVIAPLLLFTRNWRGLAGAAFATVALVGLSVVLFGRESWIAWIDSLRYGRLYMEQGYVGFYKSSSLFSTARSWGASVGLAYLVQAAGTIGAIALIWKARAAPASVRSAAVCVGAALSTPYLLDYDMAVVGVGAAFLYVEMEKSRHRPYERLTLGLIWAAPLYSRPAAQFALLPLGALAMLALAFLVWRRSDAK